MIAFTAQYQGNPDVYVIPAEGGTPKRLTWHPGEDLVQGWMPDGKSVLFRSGRNGVPTKINHFFSISLEGGLEEQPSIPQASSRDLAVYGKLAAYKPNAGWEPGGGNVRG